MRSRVRRLKIPLFVAFFFLTLSSKLGVSQQTDDQERLRELFLKSRQQMELVASPTPSPKPTPTPASSPRRHPFRPATPEPTAAGQAQSGSRATASESDDEEDQSTPTPAPPPRPAPTRPQVESTPLVEREPSTPVPTPTPKRKHHWFFFGGHDDNDSIVVQKSGAEDSRNLVPAPGDGGVQWHYLTPAVRRAIDEARVARNRWKYIIVHNSGTRQGNARIFDYYHRYVRKMPNGLAYHFVIGNGTSSGNGQIEIGNRWVRQLNGGHVHSDYLNYISLGICLVGDFNRDLPTKAEYEALDELIRYLRRRVGKVDGRYSIVRGHKEINPRPTDCPGNRFPLTWLHRAFPD
jgi:N-acetylmuramoyl-L-alanine amidase-like protein